MSAFGSFLGRVAVAAFLAGFGLALLAHALHAVAHAVRGVVAP